MPAPRRGHDTAAALDEVPAISFEEEEMDARLEAMFKR